MVDTVTGEAGVAAQAGTPVLLRLEQISQAVPGVLALDRVDFDLRAGRGARPVRRERRRQIDADLDRRRRLPADRRAHPVPRRSRSTSTRSIRRAGLGISAVFQEFSLVPQLTVEENLFLGAETATAAVPRQARDAREGARRSSSAWAFR